jgi:RNA polymerase sigma-70 factor, ECF subfamily
MTTTSLSLIEKLARPELDQIAWGRFVDLYAPLLHFWALKNGLRRDEAADLVQDVLIELMRRLPRFEYDPEQSFRSWLRRIIQNRAIDYFRRKGRQPQQAASGELTSLNAAHHVQSFTDDEYRSQLARRALELVQSEFSETTWRACWMHIVEDRDGAHIARELGITRNAVFLAKRRVLARLREELAGLWE